MPDDSDLRAEISSWRARDPGHEIAWKKVSRAWALSGQIGDVALPLHPAAIDRHLPPAPLSPWRRQWATGLVGAMAAALCAVAVAPELWEMWAADYRTTTAQTRHIQLVDGSTVDLDAESALAVEFDGKTRTVNLLSGQAYFSVTKDAVHPFIVRAGRDAVEVHGTAFNVARTSGGINVSVGHGIVSVSHDGVQVGRFLYKGDSLALADSSAPQLGTVDAAKVGGWRNKLLFADKMPFKDLIAELGRYHRGYILVRDEALNHRRVTGVFDLQRPDAALRAAVSPFNDEVVGYSPWLLVIREKR
jgi:transmembrane sensor